jgi:hypothetical protein
VDRPLGIIPSYLFLIIAARHQDLAAVLAAPQGFEPR